MVLRLINQFEQQNPKVHINAISKNYFQAQTAFVNAAEQGRTPDIFRSDVNWVAQSASRGYLLNIDPYIRGDLSDYYLPTSLGYDHYAGHYYGLPQVTDFLALLYNKAELEKAGITALPPRTMKDFAADVIKVVHNERQRMDLKQLVQATT